MRIALISTPVWTLETPPLNISYIKSYLEENGHKTKCFDLNIELFHLAKEEFRKYWKQENYFKWQDDEQYEQTVKPDVVKPNIKRFVKKIIEFNPDVIGVSVYSNKFTRDLAKRLKEEKPCLLIVAGGQVCNDRLQGVHLKQSKDIDIIVKGEGESVFNKIIETFEKKGKVDSYKGCFVRKGNKFQDCGEDERIKEIQNLPMPNFKDFQLDLYIENFDMKKPAKSLPILFSRGCNNSCDFCLQRQIWKSKLFLRKAEDVFSEMQRNIKEYEINKYVFSDLLINGNILELERLCNLIIQNNLEVYWWGSAKIDKRMTQELFHKMRKAGCHHLSVGIESFSDKVLKGMRKPSTSEDIMNFLERGKKAGITLSTNLILGHPAENRKEFLKTIQFLIEKKHFFKDQPYPSICTIYEGTDLYNKYINDKDFVYNSAIDWDYKKNDLDERNYRLKIYGLVCKALYEKFEVFDYQTTDLKD